jgi:hypothetical protein
MNQDQPLYRRINIQQLHEKYILNEVMSYIVGIFHKMYAVHKMAVV